VLVTVIETKGSTPSAVGARLILTPSGEIAGTVGGGALEKMALREAGGLLEKGGSIVKKYVLEGEKVINSGENTGMLCGGSVSLFYEYIHPGERAVIFGAGHIGKVLFRFLKELDFRVSVLDDREEPAHPSGEMKVLCYSAPGDAVAKAGNLEHSHVVIATHSHDLDFQILRAILQKGETPSYTGLVASKKKIADLLNRLKEEGIGIPENFLLYSPAGLDTGGRTPSEIALSIAAEIQAVRYKKENPGHLSRVPGTEQ